MIRLLLVDDSPLIRVALRDIFAETADIVVAGEAVNGAEAVALAEQLKPDLIIMDIVMPVMDGLTAIEEIMSRHPAPILVLSGSYAERDVTLAFTAIRMGALDLMAKPATSLSRGGDGFARQLVEKVRLLARIRVIRHPLRRKKVSGALPIAGGAGRSILAIGASTGGPRAVMGILKTLPVNFPAAVCVVQHIASGFARGFVQWLGMECRMQVRLAAEGDELRPGVILVAPDDLHMTVLGGVVRLVDEPPVNCCRPSIDLLFSSLARERGPEVVGLILTGMGKDGADGLRAIRERGGLTLAQDEESSVVFGMPKAAIALDAAEKVVSLGEIPTLITTVFSR